LHEKSFPAGRRAGLKPVDTTSMISAVLVMDLENRGKTQRDAGSA
jgi:hypothetical protein